MSNLSNPLFQKIIDSTYTKRQLERRIRSLKFYISNRLFAPGNAQIQESVGEQELYWIISLDEDFYTNFTKENMDKLLKNFEEEAAKIEPLTVFIAFDIPEADLEFLGQKLRKKYGQSFLLDVKHDPSLIGGAAVVWKGVYQDFSLAKRIRDNQAQILERIKEFVH